MTGSWLPDDDRAWMRDAACATTGVYPDSWFPEGTVNYDETRLAKRLCWDVCPVRETCLEYALDHDDQWGVWGGYSPSGRTRIRKARAAGPVRDDNPDTADPDTADPDTAERAA